MKKLNKIAKLRTVLYLDEDMHQWVNKKAEDILVSPGYIIRRMIQLQMKAEKR